MLVIAIVIIEIILMVAVYCAVRTVPLVLHLVRFPNSVGLHKRVGNLTTLHLTPPGDPSHPVQSVHFLHHAGSISDGVSK